MSKNVDINDDNSFRQDEWTIAFCEKFRELREVRIIPTNRIFAEEVGLAQTGLSHILGGRRNFPEESRLHAEKVLAKYDLDKRYLQSQNDLKDIDNLTAAEETGDRHRKSGTITHTVLTEKRNRLHEEIIHLEKERSRIEQEIDSLKNKVIKLQTILIERLEQINETPPPKGV
jgi:valyl-tRNA synthetase